MNNDPIDEAGRDHGRIRVLEEAIRKAITHCERCKGFAAASPLRCPNCQTLYKALMGRK